MPIDKWSLEEINILKEQYPKLDIENLSYILHRTKRAIISKASKLKIKRYIKIKEKVYCKNCGKELKFFCKRTNKYYPKKTQTGLCKNCSAKEVYKKRGSFTHNKGKFWTNEELIILTKEYPNIDNIKLSKILNRSRHSIERKAERIGLKKSEKFWKEHPVIVNKLFKEKELNPIWNGGTSFEPYDYRFNNRFCLSILNRDNNKCMICNKTNKEELSKHKRCLSIHHVDYNKKNTCKENCLSLCISCHTKTNTNRSAWIKFFRSLLSDRYGYDYEN